MKKELDDLDIKTLRRLTSILNGGELTKKEFTDAFEQVIQIVLNIEKRIVGNNNDAQNNLQTSLENVSKAGKADVEKFKTAALNIINNSISRMNVAIDKRLSNMEATVTSLEDGKDADEEAMLMRLMEKIPTIEEIVKYLPQAGESIRDSLELLQGNKRLKASAIDGWEELEQSIKNAQKNGTPIKFVGGARGIYVYIGGVKKGIMNTMNFVAGTNMSIAYSKVNGLDTLTLNASGGGSGGITVETPPETPDAVITAFTVSAQPQWVVADGTTYYENSGYTYNSGTGKVTMDVAPSSFIRAII